ncbi:MAG: bifunctional diaminohydroxyphosphoribosylaminopyrimidine deaminase/5-amino-6-(5-phosphoribosylamino)uracil reductase RibD [Rhodospirillales bacterium]
MATKTATKDKDTRHMLSALALARRGLGRVWPNPAVGCVLARQDREGRVVGRGWTQPGGRPHAETEALGRAGLKARGATAYVSFEPCDHQGQTPPCSQALIEAGVRRVVIAARDPDPRVSGKGICRLKEAGIEVVEGVLADQARRLNLGFILKVTEGRPLFSLKLATDRHGSIPAPGAREKWVTGPLARQRGHLLRAEHDAVLFGMGTVLEDDPEYTCRLAGMEERSPLRVLLDSELRLAPSSKLLRTIGKSHLLVIAGSDAGGSDAFTALADAASSNPGNFEITVAGKSDENGRPAAQWVALELGRRGLTRVLVEAGPKVASAFLKAGLIDCVYWFRAEKDLGAAGVPAAAGIDALKLDKTEVIEMGGDILEIYGRN